MKGRGVQSKGAERAHRIRIIGGAWKRTPIVVPDLPCLRPTPDRVRETLFNWLAFLWGGFAGRRGLDLFAGTGALGFELASRGAARVVLVERDAVLVRQQNALRDKLGAANVDVVAGDAFALAPTLPAGSFDIVFLDPPFGSDLLQPALEAAARLIAASGLVYVEWNRRLAPADVEPGGLTMVRAGRAGQVAFHLLAAADGQ